MSQPPKVCSLDTPLWLSAHRRSERRRHLPGNKITLYVSVTTCVVKTLASIAKPQYATSSGVRMVLILAWIENAHDERAIS